MNLKSFLFLAVVLGINGCALFKNLEERCNSNDARACFNLAYEFDIGDSSVRDWPRAARLYEKSCKLGEASACVNLGVLVASGNLGSQDAERSAKLYLKACQLRAQSGCGDIAGRLQSGWGIKKDLALAEHFGVYGCNEGKSAYSCRMAARIFVEKGDSQNAEKYFRMACNGNRGEACKELGDLLHSQEKHSAAKKFYRRALPLLTTRCFKTKRPIACSLLADLLTSNPDFASHNVTKEAAKKFACELSKRHCNL